jgi:hypothetical protein
MYALVRAIRFSVFGLALMSVTVCCGAWTYFYSNRPVVPCPEENRTYALNIHGLILYLTQGEHRLIDWSFDASCCFVLVAVILSAIEGGNFRGRK